MSDDPKPGKKHDGKKQDGKKKKGKKGVLSASGKDIGVGVAGGAGVPVATAGAPDGLDRKGSKTLSERLRLAGSQGDLIPSLSTLDLGPRSKRSDLAKLMTSADASKANEKLSEEIQQLAEALEQECFFIIFTVIPSKIRTLDALFKRNPAFSRTSEQVKAAGPLPSLLEGPNYVKLAGEPFKTVVPHNTALVELSELLKVEMLELQEYMNSLSIWIKLNVPRLSDGVSFNEEVQMSLLQIIEGAEEVGFGVLDQFAAYHLTRAELITKSLKYPGVADYERAIIELDEKSYLKTSLVAADVRALYLTLFDSLSKNLQSLLEKSEDPAKKQASMYY